VCAVLFSARRIILRERKKVNTFLKKVFWERET